MTDILLITDVPRLRKVFSRLNDEPNIRLRIANRLERGGEEIAAEKPDMVFVQTHLSGLSGDILLLHLKKQLGRRRSRFVLLGSPANITPEALKLYHSHLDTSLSDNELFDAIREVIKSTFSKGRKPGVSPPAPDAAIPSLPEPEISPAAPEQQPEPLAAGNFSPMSVPAGDTFPQGSNDRETDAPPLTYERPSRLKVYSEFTSSFDSAVSTLEQPEKGTEKNTPSGWPGLPPGNIETTPTRSGKVNFLLWFAPLLIAVVAVTIVQHRGSETKAVDVAPGAPPVPVAASKVDPAVSTAPVAATPAVPRPNPANPPSLPSPAATVPAKEPAAVAESAKRPVKLPDFIPRYGYDKKYGAANPGWERYKGEVTEFKIFKEGGAIKAIQVIDQGGHGVPESFMKNALRQLVAKPDFSVKSSEKKGGYEIQHGQIAGNISVLYYRDADGGQLRAFVVTW